MEPLTPSQDSDLQSAYDGWIQWMHDDERGVRDLDRLECPDWEDTVLTQWMDLARTWAPLSTWSASVARHALHFGPFPPRAYTHSWIRALPDVERVTARLAHLRTQHAALQRTPEWETLRRELFTASTLHKALGSVAQQNALLFSKCQPPNAPAAFHGLYGTGPMYWGTVMEPVTRQFYEHRYATRIEEFGCLRHDTCAYLAASPDGINADPASPRYGRLVEFKNVVSRVLTGTPTREYWIQMQTQLEVCGLDECDFMETQFVEYATRRDWEDAHIADPSVEAGWFVRWQAPDGTLHHAYPPWGISLEDKEAWDAAYDPPPDWEFVSRNYWRLTNWSCVLVARQPRWWHDVALPQVDRLWATLQRERVEGHAHRAPRSRPRPLPVPDPPRCRLQWTQDPADEAWMDEAWMDVSPVDEAPVDEAPVDVSPVDVSADDSWVDVSWEDVEVPP
jgi:hypothetical protein